MDLEAFRARRAAGNDVLLVTQEQKDAQQKEYQDIAAKYRAISYSPEMLREVFEWHKRRYVTACMMHMEVAFKMCIPESKKLFDELTQERGYEAYVEFVPGMLKKYVSPVDENKLFYLVMVPVDATREEIEFSTKKKVVERDYSVGWCMLILAWVILMLAVWNT